MAELEENIIIAHEVCKHLALRYLFMNLNIFAFGEASSLDI